MWERYELKDVALKKCRELLYSAKKFKNDDPRITSFADFIGLCEDKPNLEAPFIYVKLLNASKLSFDLIFSKTWNVPLLFEDAYKYIKSYFLMIS